jgi:short-subunit dehydrogenase
MNKWALVTGTTSGIGKSFCTLLATEGYNLVLVSRNLPRMKSQSDLLKSTYNIEVEILQADLSDIVQINTVATRCADTSRPIEVLVNNAGFGINSSFSRSAIQSQENLINCMVMAPMKLTHSAIKTMESIGGGIIINVSSVAAFMAGSTYCSAKSWLTVFSESLHTESKTKNIKIHSICPGFTRTEFHERCKQDVSGVPNIFWLKPEKIAQIAWKKADKGVVISIPGLHYKGLVFLHRFAPRFIVRIYGKIATKILLKK